MAHIHDWLLILLLLYLIIFMKQFRLAFKSYVNSINEPAHEKKGFSVCVSSKVRMLSSLFGLQTCMLA